MPRIPNSFPRVRLGPSLATTSRFSGLGGARPRQQVAAAPRGPRPHHAASAEDRRGNPRWPWHTSRSSGPRSSASARSRDLPSFARVSHPSHDGTIRSPDHSCVDPSAGFVSPPRRKRQARGKSSHNSRETANPCKARPATSGMDNAACARSRRRSSLADSQVVLADGRSPS